MKSNYFLILSFLLWPFYFVFGENGEGKCGVFPGTINGDNVFVQADVLTFDKKNNVFKATGKVHLIQNKKGVEEHLFCDEVVYDKKRNRAIATGNIVFKDGLKNTAYLDYLELSDDFKNGFAKTVHIITNKSERMIGDRGIRENGNFTRFFNASYTPCLVSGKEDASWQFNAKEAVHDKEEQVIRYYHVTFSIYGFPVFYSPYFSHVDPKVKRKSGLLIPAFQHTERDGATIVPSVYFVIDKYSDLTLSPIIMRYTNPILAGIYRRNIYNGEFSLNFSAQNNKFNSENVFDRRLGEDKENIKNYRKIYFTDGTRKTVNNRWHLFFDLAKDINENQRFKLNISRASDVNYLSDYTRLLNSTSSDDNKALASKFLYEYFQPKNYMGLKAYSFQSSSQSTTPFVFPAIFYQSFLDHKVFDGSSKITFYSDYISRNMDKPGAYAKKTMRFYSHYQWNRDWIIKNNLLEVSLEGFCRGYLVDGYKKVEKPENKTEKTENKRDYTRLLFLPTAKFSWSYPLIAIGKNLSYLVEPKISLITSPLQRSSMPNNDSRTFTMDDSTIFMTNRFDGYDRFDSGTRLVYGLFQKIYFSNSSRYASWFVGRSRRLDNNDILGNVNLGEYKNQSDIVNYIKVVPLEYFKMRYRNAINFKTKKERFREVGLSVGKPFLSLNASYVDLKSHSFLDERLSQINWMFASEVNKNWSLSYGEVRDLSGHEKAVLNKFSTVSWKNDCVKIKFLAFSTKYKKTDAERNKGFSLSVEFKFMGVYTFAPAPYEYVDTGLSHF